MLGPAQAGARSAGGQRPARFLAGEDLFAAFFAGDLLAAAAFFTGAAFFFAGAAFLAGAFFLAGDLLAGAAFLAGAFFLAGDLLAGAAFFAGAFFFTGAFFLAGAAFLAGAFFFAGAFFCAARLVGATFLAAAGLLAGAFLAGADLAGALSSASASGSRSADGVARLGMADSHTMGWLVLAEGEEVQVPEKPRELDCGTGVRRAGLAKRAWLAMAWRRARSRASSASDGLTREIT